MATTTTLQVLRAAGNGETEHLQRLFHESRRTRTTRQVCSPTTTTSSSSNQHPAQCRSRLHGTPLEAASRQGRTAVVALLLTAAAPVNAAKRGGWTPLQSACVGGHTDVVRLLLKAGADPRLTLVANGHAALHTAAGAGHVAICQLLVSAAATKTTDSAEPRPSLTNAVDHAGWTALHVASYHGKVAVVRYLVTQAVDAIHVETRNRDGRTALQVASRQTRRTVRRLDVVRLLQIEAGASLDSMDDGGATPLGSAVERCDLAMLRCLLRSGATVRRADLVRAAPTPDALYPLLRAAVSQGLLSRSPFPSSR